MSLQAEVIAIGPFDVAIEDVLDFGPEVYENVKSGTRVVARLFRCGTSHSCYLLAEALGVRVWDFNSHPIDASKIRWDLLKDQNEVCRLRKLIDAGFEIIFCPRMAEW